MSHTQERLIPPQIQSEPDPTQPTSGGVADNLYYPESTNVGPRGGAEFGSFGKFNRGPKPTYNRSVAGYTGELNEVMPAGKPLFDINDWNGKTLLDIGSGGYDRFGMEAGAKGVRVISLNPMLQDESSREMLQAGVAMAQRNARHEAWERWSDQSWFKRLVTKPDEAPQVRSKSVAALGQALPIRSNSVDGVVSVFGVPHYLYSGMFKNDAPADPAVRHQQDVARLAAAFQEIERVLKPGGRALLKDDYNDPTHVEGTPFVPENGGAAVEALRQLKGSNFEIHINPDPEAESNQRGGVMRVIEITKHAADGTPAAKTD